MFWDRSYGPFPAFFISIHVLNHKFLELKHPNSPLNVRAVTAIQENPKNFHKFGPMFWDRSNGPSRPQTNRNISKTFKMGIKPKQGENPTSRSLKKLPIPESTRSLSRVEHFSFLPRRPPTVGSSAFIERSQRLSL